MMRKMLKSKIHRATVTGADLHYEGSITIDPVLMDAADILDNEFVDIWNVDYGTRFSTYAIKGQPGSGVICINGAAARLVSKGDLVIIASWQEMEDKEAKSHQPKLVFVDEHNRQKELCRDQERPGQGDLKRAI
ncbi:MAG: aspartate 1-decarboxylase [Deltaproteobacteria bacterium]|jgi:aspartate 1-decarboxylase|nr:aspartate 1-decarboxylase [Deltaproteobacteria bacterium]